MLEQWLPTLFFIGFMILAPSCAVWGVIFYREYKRKDDWRTPAILTERDLRKMEEAEKRAFLTYITRKKLA